MIIYIVLVFGKKHWPEWTGPAFYSEPRADVSLILISNFRVHGHSYFLQSWYLYASALNLETRGHVFEWLKREVKARIWTFEIFEAFQTLLYRWTLKSATHSLKRGIFAPRLLLSNFEVFFLLCISGICVLALNFWLKIKSYKIKADYNRGAQMCSNFSRESSASDSKLHRC